MDREKTPVGYSLAMVQNEDVTASYTGFTREQKREMLTHALIARSGEGSVPLAADSTVQNRENLPQEHRK